MKKWQLWPKNVITQIFQRLYNLISILATYRAALVQNQHLSILAEVLGLEKYMLYAHGSDLCHDTELRHAMANCFEALMGAIYLDGGIGGYYKVKW